jgi:putative ABC transport system substrate-binding protein
MRRRDLISVIGGALVAPFAARAQEPGRIYRVGHLALIARDASQYVALYTALKSEGFVAGQNLMIDPRNFGLRVDQLGDRAAAVVKAQADAIVCSGDSPVRAAQQATKTIPIVGVADDMLKSGFVNSLAKPEGNTTGVSILATELDGKRQEILLELVPGIRRMAALADTNGTLPQQLQALQDAARARGVDLSIYRVAKPEEVAGAIDGAKASGAAALNVLASAFLFSNRQTIIRRAAELDLPAVYQFPAMAEEGGLIGYGSRIEQIYQDIISRQLARVLRGAKIADIPVEQPTKFDLAVNLKTAKALGLTIPESFLVRADKVIE